MARLASKAQEAQYRVRITARRRRRGICGLKAECRSRFPRIRREGKVERLVLVVGLEFHMELHAERQLRPRDRYLHGISVLVLSNYQRKGSLDFSGAVVGFCHAT